MAEIHFDFLNFNTILLVLLILLVGGYLYYEIHKMKITINDIHSRLNYLLENNIHHEEPLSSVHVMDPVLNSDEFDIDSNKDNIQDNQYSDDKNAIEQDDFFSKYHSANFKTGMYNVDQSKSKVPNKDLRTYTSNLPFYSVDYFNVKEEIDSEDLEIDSEDQEIDNNLLNVKNNVGKDKDVVLQYDNSLMANFY